MKEEPFEPKPEPNIRSHEAPEAPPDLMPKEGGNPTVDPEGTRDAEFMRINSPEERPNSSSEPE